MVKRGKTFSSLIFWKHGAVDEFYGAIDISFQIRGGGGVGSGVSRHPRSGKAEVVTHGTCTSKSTRHVTFKSPFLLECPYCELCDNDIKQSSYRLMNVLFRSKALFPDFGKSLKYLTTEERTTTISHFFCLHASL